DAQGPRARRKGRRDRRGDAVTQGFQARQEVALPEFLADALTALGKTTANLLPELTQHDRVLQFSFGRSPAGERPTVRPLRATGHGLSSILQDTVCLAVR